MQFSLPEHLLQPTSKKANSVTTLGNTCLFVGCKGLLKLNAQHFVLLADLSQGVLQLNHFRSQLLLETDFIPLVRTAEKSMPQLGKKSPAPTTHRC